MKHTITILDNESLVSFTLMKNHSALTGTFTAFVSYNLRGSARKLAFEAQTWQKKSLFEKCIIAMNLKLKML